MRNLRRASVIISFLVVMVMSYRNFTSNAGLFDWVITFGVYLLSLLLMVLENNLEKSGR